MTSPISAGDRAEVIGGVQGSQSPNLGLIVKVLAFRGEHTLYGRIWRCEAEYAELAQPGGTIDKDGQFLPRVGITVGQADFAQDWLRKIEPPEDSTKSSNETHLTKEFTS